MTQLAASHDRPATTTFELSIFGAGVGEALVLHIGDNEWLLVDSCINHGRGLPAGVAYLDDLCVAAEAVRAVVVTHWHEDHVAGIDGVMKKYPGAAVHLPASFHSSHLYKLVRAGAERDTLGTDALQTSKSFSRAVNVLIQQGRTFAVAPTQIDRVIRSKVIAGIGQMSVTALSPSDFASMTALQQFADFVQRDLPLRRRPVASDPNHSAIALWVRWGDHRILLGSDLLDLPNKSLGWSAALGAQVLSSESEKAIVVKVAHHGSANGHSAVFWNKHVNASAAGLTTYAAGKSPPPQAGDIDRLKRCCSQVLCAPAPSAPRALKAKSISKFHERQGIAVTQRVRRFGQIRIRLDASGTLSTSCYGEARVL